MEHTVSRKSIKFYVDTIVGFLIFLSISVFFAFTFIAKTNDDHDTKSYMIYLLPLFSLVSFIFSILTFYFYVKYVPSIIISNNAIKVQNKAYALSDIKFVIYTGKQPFLYSYKEGAEIVLNDGSTIYIYDELYANAPALKTFLDSVLNDRIIINVPISRYDISTENIRYYTQGIFSNKKLFVISTLSIAITILIIIEANISWYIMLLPIFTFLIICPLVSSEMYYFGINEKYLVVRNHVLFWRKHIYPISSVREVVYEPRYKWRRGLRIITKNYHTNFRIAETLNSVDWQELQKDFKNQNIKVRYELKF